MSFHGLRLFSDEGLESSLKARGFFREVKHPELIVVQLSWSTYQLVVIYNPYGTALSSRRQRPDLSERIGVSEEEFKSLSSEGVI